MNDRNFKWEVKPVDEPMEMRDKFALAAMVELIGDTENQPATNESVRAFADRIATGAYIYADAMMDARRKDPTP